ncbi:hypothetical protein Tco_0769313 [Tanacetum coccineum]|uniref:Uncharacterized protein n=1 Tax=Tanacetum coccineum TaxID=301880 RepID=A0ABQ4ZBZ4_9ASTR
MISDLPTMFTKRPVGHPKRIEILPHENKKDANVDDVVDMDTFKKHAKDLHLMRVHLKYLHLMRVHLKYLHLNHVNHPQETSEEHKSGEEERNDDNDIATGNDIEKPSGTKMGMPVKEAEKENEVENGIKYEPIRKTGKEETTEAPSS